MTFLMCGWPVVRAESFDGNALSSCSADRVFATKVHLVLEQCDMDLLRHVAANATCFPEKDAAVYSAQLLCAIAHIHARSVMHRNIKLEDLLLRSSGHHVSG